MPRALCGVPRGTLENLRKSLYQLRDLAWSDPDPWSPYLELPHPVLGAFGPSLGNTSGTLFKIVKALPLCKGRENLDLGPLPPLLFSQLGMRMSHPRMFADLQG